MLRRTHIYFHFRHESGVRFGSVPRCFQTSPSQPLERVPKCGSDDMTPENCVVFKIVMFPDLNELQ